MALLPASLSRAGSRSPGLCASGGSGVEDRGRWLGWAVRPQEAASPEAGTLCAGWERGPVDPGVDGGCQRSAAAVASA